MNRGLGRAKWGARLGLGTSLWLAAAAHAQTPGVPSQPGATALWIGVGGLLAGGALGWALRRKTTPAPQMPADFSWFDQAPFALALCDENERIARANAPFCAFLRVESAGDSLSSWLHPDDITRFRDSWNALWSGERAAFSLECRFFGADEVPRCAALSARRARLDGREWVSLALQDVTALVEAQRELAGARQAISALYEVIAGEGRDLESSLRALLQMGCERFELPIGALGRFAGEQFETLFTRSADRRVRPALCLPRGDASPEARLLGLSLLPDASNWRAHPFVTGTQGATYLGAPVLVDGELFGMLSFSGWEERAPLAGADIELLQLMAEWVGGEIERDAARRALEREQKALLEANQKLEKLATHDALTGVKNRRAFEERLAEEWSRARRYQTPLSLVLLDVDNFKSYNDTFGHPAGDEVLRRVGRVLTAGVRATDFLARYGGEEFVLILPNTDAGGAFILCERLRQKIEGAAWTARPVTASLGVASWPGDFPDAASLLQAADEALYRSKQAGRNRVTPAP